MPGAARAERRMIVGDLRLTGRAERVFVRRGGVRAAEHAIAGKNEVDEAFEQMSEHAGILSFVLVRVKVRVEGNQQKAKREGPLTQSP